jgi:PAS domain S-box-containing protein
MGPLKPRRPLQVYLAISALALLVAIVAVLGSWQVVAARDSQRTEIENGEVTAAHLASSALASALASRLELLNNLADQPALAKFFASTTPAQAAQLAATLHLLYPSFASFAIISGQGTLEGRWPTEASVVGKNLVHEDVFRGIVRTGKPYVAAATQQTSPPHELVVGLAVPIHNAKGQLVGILDGTLAAKSFGSLIGGTTLQGSGNLVVIDQAGHVLTGPAANASRSFSSLPLVAGALAGHSGATSGSVPGYSGSRLVGFAPVRSTGWAVIAEDPPAVLNGPLAGLTERLIAIGLIVLVLAIGTALLVGLLLRRLHREQEETGAVLASVGEGVATLDRAGSPVRVNPALEALIGRQALELEGSDWSEAFALYDSRGRHLSWEESIAAQAVRERRVVASTGYDLHLAHPDGSRIPVAMTAAPLLVRGELTGAVVVLRDVSREREVDQLKSSLVSTVSHELRTPLTMIQGFSELLLDRDDLGATRSREALQQVNASALRLGRLIDDLLSVSRIDSGKLTVEFAPVDVLGVVSEVVATFEAQTDRRFVTNLAPGLPRVMADRDKMVQVLTNLVSNAVKYSFSPAPIEIVVTAAGNHAEVAVVDRGIGISEAERSQIFEKFTRADRPEVRNVGGTGLGLYITQSLIQLQNGQLWVRSEPGEGSTFAFSLPFAQGTRAIDMERHTEEVILEEALDR